MALPLDSLSGGPCILESDYDSLVAEVSAGEIKAALIDIDNNKAPGSDGFGSMFFKSAWDIVSGDVIAAVKEFFVSGRLLKQWNHTVIALIPKSPSAASPSDYRPISCCTTICKIISKILVMRLRKVMPGIVDGSQSDFIHGRSIVDNIHLAQELLRKYARKRISPRCTLKVDLQKAYDTVDWDFLKETLTFLNFPCRFIDWIMKCVSTTS